MPDTTRTCVSCGKVFWVTEKELKECMIPVPGMHHPKDCPEHLDAICPKCDIGVYGPEECPACRTKQDQQRN